MKRIIYSSLSVLTALGTVFVAAKAEVFKPDGNTAEATEAFTSLDEPLNSLSDSSLSDADLFSSSAAAETGLSAFGSPERGALSARVPASLNGGLKGGLKAQGSIRPQGIGAKDAIASAATDKVQSVPVTTPIATTGFANRTAQRFPGFSTASATSPSVSRTSISQIAQAQVPPVVEEEPAAVPAEKPSAMPVTPSATPALPDATGTSLPAPAATPSPIVIPSTVVPETTVPTPGIGADMTPGVAPAAVQGVPAAVPAAAPVEESSFDEAMPAVPVEQPLEPESFEVTPAEAPVETPVEAVPADIEEDLEPFGEGMPEAPIEEDAFEEEALEEEDVDASLEEEDVIEEDTPAVEAEDEVFEELPADGSIDMEDGSIEMEIEQAPFGDPVPAAPNAPITPSAPVTPSAPITPDAPVVPSAPVTPDAPVPATPVPSAPSSTDAPIEAPLEAAPEVPVEAPIEAPLEAPIQTLPPVDDGMLEPEAFPEAPAVDEGFSDSGDSGRLVGEGFTPFQLSYLAISGGLKEEGIPGGGLLVSAYKDGDVSAEDIVAAGAVTKRLGTAAADESDYTESVDDFLKLFVRDNRSN
ncbi:MAG: hypothetical protein AAFU53_05355 [Cyanobacteria bacterium J06632_3]